MAMKIEPKNTATLGLETWVRRPFINGLATASFFFVVKGDRDSRVTEDLKGDPEQEKGADNLHRNEKRRHGSKQYVQAEKRGNRPQNRSSPQPERDPDAIRA